MDDWTKTSAKDATERVAQLIEKRRSQGETMTPYAVAKGKKLATQFWGQSWQRHLESYAIYEQRLPAGRSYLRNGKVYNITTEPSLVTAEVAGTQLYEVSVHIKPMDPDSWEEMKTSCRGQISSLLDLMEGRLGDGVMRALCAPDLGLFPEIRQIRVQCNCTDYADLCKHGAAVLYAIGLQFDQSPDLFFKLRGVNAAELIGSTAGELQPPTSGSAGEVIADDDIAALFGIDLDAAD